MNKPSYFDREVKIKTPDQMFAKLRERTGKLKPEREEVVIGSPDLPPAELSPPGTAASTLDSVPTPVAAVGSEDSVSFSAESSRPPGLVWEKPVKATQTTQDGRYRLSRVETKGVVLYWAWSEQKPVPKLLDIPRLPRLREPSVRSTRMRSHETLRASGNAGHRSAVGTCHRVLHGARTVNSDAQT